MVMLIAPTDGPGMLPATPELVWGVTSVLILVAPNLPERGGHGADARVQREVRRS